MRKQTEEKRLPIALYCRVSTASQEAKGTSLKNQEDVLRQYCALRFPEVPLVVYSERGSARRTNRRHYKIMMREAHYKQIRMIIATDQARLWRNLGDALVEMKKLKSWGCDLLLWRQGIDTTTPAGMMIFALFGAIGQFESDDVSRRTKRALDMKKSRGEKGPGLRPFGWNYNAKNEIVRNEKEQGFADLIALQRAAGKTWGGCAEYGNSTSVKTVRGLEWTCEGLRLIMKSVDRRRESEATRLIE